MKRVPTQYAAALALMAVPNMAYAQAAKPCLTSAEARNLIMFALPEVLSSVMDRCKATLPAGAFLVKSGPELVARYKASGASAWPSAKAAVFKIAGPEAKMLEALPDEAAKSLFAVGINSALASGIKPEQCSFVDRGVAALAPLPVENLADFTTMVLELGAAGKAGKGGNSPLNICPAEGRPAPINAPTGTSGAETSK